MRVPLFITLLPIMLSGQVYGHSTEHYDHSQQHNQEHKPSHKHEHGHQHSDKHDHKHAHDHQHSHDEHRHHGAHVHGAAHVDLVIADNELMFSLLSPAMDIVGFEHAPANAEQQAQLDTALQKLADPETVLKLHNGGCQLQSASVSNPFETTPDHDHVDIEAQYMFMCDTPDAIRLIDVTLFEHFPAIESVNLQMVTSTSQIQQRLTSGQSQLRITE